MATKNLWEMVSDLEKQKLVNVEAINQRRALVLIEKLGFSFNDSSEGSLLDNWLYESPDCKHSLIMAERYVNPNMSEYVAIYGNITVIHFLWDEYLADDDEEAI